MQPPLHRALRAKAEGRRPKADRDHMPPGLPEVVVVADELLPVVADVTAGNEMTEPPETVMVPELPAGAASCNASKSMIARTYSSDANSSLLRACARSR